MSRYKRQLTIIGDEGQELISSATVMVVGAGGIGSSVLTYLAAAGIGKLIVIDHDKVELSNLHRQIIFKEEDIGFYKAEKAQDHLSKTNSSIIIESYNNELDLELAHKLIPSVDLIIDGTDNYEARYLINDVCALYEKPLISCSILKDIIQLVLFDTKKICYRCIYPKAPPAGMIPNCSDMGVLGTVAGIAGTLTANLAVNYVLQLEKCQNPVMRIFDARDFSLVTLPVIANKNCMACQQKAAPQASHEKTIELGVFLGEIDRQTYFIVDIREPQERAIQKLDDDLFFPIKDNLNYDFFLSYKKKRILLYCASGYRSKIFALELREMGVNAFYLKNGINKL